MQLSCAYLEGKDIFQDLASTRHGVLVDPRVRADHIWSDVAESGVSTRGGFTQFIPWQGALEAAHMNTKVPGSATACVMQLDQVNGILAAANLVRVCRGVCLRD